MSCPHWTDCGVTGGGCCGKNLYGGKPSFGVCNSVCEFGPVEAKPVVATPSLPAPTFADQAASLTKALMDWGAAGFPIAADHDERRAICLRCDQWTGIKCKACGCTGLKWFLATTKCPLNKWPS